ncbi:MAG: AmiS/UreI family transporter [Haloplanus sp.]
MALINTLGMGLVYVGAVLIVNGLWLLGYGDGDDVAILNFLTGLITFLIAVWWGFFPEASAGTPFNAAGTLLFSFTYLWVGANAWRGIDDQRGFGWYCLFVAALAAPTGFLVFQAGDIGLAALWWIWAVLWFTFWVLLGIERDEYTSIIGWYTTAVGIVSGAAGYVMAMGAWPWA